MLTQQKQRHTKDFLCPVCDFYDDPRGRGNGTRCNGATWETTEGQVYSICSRQESPRPSESDGWIHWVNGPCDCGISHGEEKQQVVRGGSANEGDYVSSPVEMTHIKEHLPPLEKVGEPYAMTILMYSGIEYQHMRQDYVDLETGKRTKKIWWTPNPSVAGHSPKDFPLHQPAGQVIQSQDDVVVIVEGQKAANAVWAADFKVLGLYGTGTKPTDRALLQYLKETARILIWPDADQSGRECMSEIWGRLNTLLPDARLSWVEVPEAEDKDDAADCSAERVKELINQIIDKPQSDEKYGLQPKEFADTFPVDVPEWAFFGALGKITFAMDPFTEADKHALFMQMLTAAGALTGISPHVANAVGHPQLYTTLVGKTGARKGTSWRNVETYFLRPLMNSLGMSREQQMEFIVRGVM